MRRRLVAVGALYVRTTIYGRKNAKKQGFNKDRVQSTFII